MEMIAVRSLRFSIPDKIILSLEPSMRSLHLEEGKLIDMKITHNKIWILKEDGSMLYDLFHTDVNMEHTYSYGLQEAFVADLLFQGSDHTSDDLIWASDSIFSSLKDQVVPFVSSIFLRRLLHPGVPQNAALRATMQDHNKHLSDSEFQSLTVNGLKKEILSIIEFEGVAESPISVIYYWKKFCSQFFHYWCQNSIPYGLLIDSSRGAIALIRKNSVSVFRCLEDVEQLIYGCFDEFGDFINSGLVLPDDDTDREILFEVLRCISSINHQLGKAAAAVFYESLVSPSVISSEDVIPCLVKILVSGYSSSVTTAHRSQFGADIASQKEKADHKSQRKFSIEMLLSLRSLCSKATNWGRVLDVVEKYLKYLIPNKHVYGQDSKEFFNVNSLLLIQATSQVARVMLDSAFDILVLLCYLVNISGQVCMVHEDISRIQLQLIPMIQDLLTPWLVLHLTGTTPSESPILDEFSSRLSSLHIDNKTDKRSWDEKLGTRNFTLACILLRNFPGSSENHGYFSSRYFPDPNNFISSIRNFSSWIVWGSTTEESQASFSHGTELAILLLKHGQYEAVENLLVIIGAHSHMEKSCQSAQSTNGDWCARLHLMGFCLLVRAHSGLRGALKGRKVREAVRCFFRAACGENAHQALQSIFFQTGLPYPAHTGSATAWKLHYYQWAMQLFEQYNMSEGACQFALAALEQVDELYSLEHDINGPDSPIEPPNTIRGRLWANVFKFTLDLNNYTDAYCAITSNPDEDSKYICLRRFIIVLCEHGVAKVLCDGELPFVGLIDKVEQELVWKAERSDITTKPNPYKLLYTFEMYRHNWRKAASYMYQYATRLKKEANLKECPQLSHKLQERLQGLSAAISALHLVHCDFAWIDSQLENYIGPDQHSPNKKARRIMEGNAINRDDPESWSVQCYIDIERLENEYVLTSAQYLLVLANVKPAFAGSQTVLSDLVDLLIQADFYDMAFTILLKFWKGSGLKRELERVFIAISQKCCPNRVGSSSFVGIHGLLLGSSWDESRVDGKIDMDTAIHHSKGNKQWETLELYLGKYKKLHLRLPATVAETLLHTDPQIELPLWLVHMFKGGRRVTSWGMSGHEPEPATLFRLYVDYGRYTEATNLLLEYIESFASLRPADIINRKRMSAICFPYTAIEQLWCQLEELRSSGHMVDQCDTLKKLLHGALLNHLKQIKVDSDDALASALQ
ncbi:SUPPRESSOR OF AUXIN RESISTANCE1 isoform X2 [Tasmannia lanceolata]